MILGGERAWPVFLEWRLTSPISIIRPMGILKHTIVWKNVHAIAFILSWTIRDGHDNLPIIHPVSHFSSWINNHHLNHHNTIYHRFPYHHHLEFAALNTEKKCNQRYLIRYKILGLYIKLFNFWHLTVSLNFGGHSWTRVLHDAWTPSSSGLKHKTHITICA